MYYVVNIFLTVIVVKNVERTLLTIKDGAYAAPKRAKTARFAIARVVISLLVFI